MKHTNYKQDFGRIFICPYCCNELSESWSACCGEAGHGQYVYIDEDGEIIEDSV